MKIIITWLRDPFSKFRNNKLVITRLFLTITRYFFAITKYFFLRNKIFSRNNDSINSKYREIFSWLRVIQLFSVSLSRNRTFTPDSLTFQVTWVLLLVLVRRRVSSIVRCPLTIVYFQLLLKNYNANYYNFF